MLTATALDQARTMGLVNGHVMEGVQFDEMGRRVAYWLFSYHPGGVLILNPRGGIVSQPVPADQIMHVYSVLRPGQVRGVPWLAPVMMALRDLDDYCDAERVRKKVEACVTAFVQQPEGVDGDPLGIAGTDPSSGLPVESFQPGMVEYLKPGQDIKFNNPLPAGGYREYKMTELQGIMAGIGLPYELGTGDMSQVNYSSWRGGMLGFRNPVGLASGHVVRARRRVSRSRLPLPEVRLLRADRVGWLPRVRCRLESHRRQPRARLS
jgi:lambda family phage portal protein